MRKTALLLAMLMCISTVGAAAGEDICIPSGSADTSFVRIDLPSSERSVRPARVTADQPEAVCENAMYLPAPLCFPLPEFAGLSGIRGRRIFYLRE